MVKQVDWSKYFINIDTKKIEEIQKKFGHKKIYALGLMPVRGPIGFRKLDYEFAEKKLNVIEILDKMEEAHFNVLGLVIKDTDGACMWDTEVGWNPTGRDILGEFCDAGKDRNIFVLASFTSMNDAYQGAIHPERVSVHGKAVKYHGVKYKKGDISTHDEGEMRVDLPVGTPLEEYMKKIPFLTNKLDKNIGKRRGSRGQGYIPQTSFMCPTSEHIDYLVNLADEVVRGYPIKSIFADYIRYDGSFTDLCSCERCQGLFREKYGNKPKILKSKEWFDFKEDNIAAYAKKLHNKVKRIDQNCLTGWFMLPGPKKLFTRKRIAQNWIKLSSILDIVSPMEYPYLIGTYDDGWLWGKLADLAYWYFIRNLKKRAHEFRSPALTVTNSVECNAQEMLKQMRGFDFGLGIAIFKYFGTSEPQWKALKKYAEEELGLENLKPN
ncbi:MAG: hypothetical protein ACTSR8_15525 [Promethearchaeota archaeon]